MEKIKLFYSKYDYKIKLLFSKYTYKDKRVCPCCNNKVPYFKPYGEFIHRYNVECPICRSEPRDRAIQFYLIPRLEKYKRVLHFAPERWLYDILSKKNGIDYYPVDINEECEMIRQTEDICNLSFENDFFDLIICNHVLEHVQDLARGLNNLYRVLKDDGIAIVTVPLSKRNETLEEDWINTDELREKYYGYKEHRRQFAEGDFSKIMAVYGFEAKAIEARDLLNRKEMHVYGLTPNRKIFVLKKFD